MANNPFNIDVTAKDGFSKVFSNIGKVLAGTNSRFTRLGRSINQLGASRGFADVIKGVGGIKNEAAGAVSSLEKMFTPLEGIAALTSVGGIVGATEKWAKLGRTINQTSRELGMGVEEVQLFQGVGKRFGKDADTTANSLINLGRTAEAVLYRKPGTDVENSFLGFYGMQDLYGHYDPRHPEKAATHNSLMDSLKILNTKYNQLKKEKGALEAGSMLEAMPEWQPFKAEITAPIEELNKIFEEEKNKFNLSPEDVKKAENSWKSFNNLYDSIGKFINYQVGNSGLAAAADWLAEKTDHYTKSAATAERMGHKPGYISSHLPGFIGKIADEIPALYTIYNANSEIEDAKNPEKKERYQAMMKQEPGALGDIPLWQILRDMNWQRKEDENKIVVDVNLNGFPKNSSSSVSASSANVSAKINHSLPGSKN